VLLGGVNYWPSLSVTNTLTCSSMRASVTMERSLAQIEVAQAEAQERLAAATHR
jgi:hypothetical protein